MNFLMAALLLCAATPDQCVVTQMQRATHVSVCGVTPGMARMVTWSQRVRRDGRVYLVVVSSGCVGA